MKNIYKFMLVTLVVITLFFNNLKPVSANIISGAWDVNGSNFYYNGGNVGVGTSTPFDMLNVYNGSEGRMLVGNGGSSWWTWAGSNASSTSYARMMVNGYYNGTGWVRREAGKESWLIQGTTSTGNNGVFVLQHGDAGSGNNITNMPAVLMVKADGTVLVKKLVVQDPTLWWADYVFDNNYSLMSLDKLESYIITNKHLPNIPSAEELEKNGISISDMQAKQMQKIEELTLYTIQQGKDIKGLKNDNDELKKKNEELEERLSNLEKFVYQK
jgi:hypothetical protein